MFKLINFYHCYYYCYIMSSSKFKKELSEKYTTGLTVDKIKQFFYEKSINDNAKKLHLFQRIEENSDQTKLKVELYKESILNKYFDQIYVINLPKQLNRRVTIVSQFNQLGIKYKFIDGINGLDPQYHEEWKKYRINPGIWGYYMVMIKIFNDAIKAGHKSIVVFDDDVVFHNNFQYMNKTFEYLLRKQWLTILLGASEPSWKYYNDQVIQNNGYYNPKRTDGSFAVCYNYPSYHYLLHECIKFRGTYDSYALRSLYDRYPNACFTLYPNLVIADVSKSSLREERDMIKSCQKFRWNIEEYNYHNRGEPVTILIYFKDQVEQLAALLPSILKQDYNNIQIKILDDCSKNRTANAVKQLSNTFSNVELISNQYPMGYLPTLKKAVYTSESKYIFILDIDRKTDVNKNLVSALLSYYLVKGYDQPILLKPVDYKSVFASKKHLRLSWRADLETMEPYLKSKGIVHIVG